MSAQKSAGCAQAAMFAQYRRVCRVVDDVQRSLSTPREEADLGSLELTLYALTEVRYVHAGEQPPVAASAISERPCASG